MGTSYTVVMAEDAVHHEHGEGVRVFFTRTIAVFRDASAASALASLLNAVGKPDRFHVHSRDNAAANFNAKVARILLDAGIFKAKALSWSAQWTEDMNFTVTEVDSF